MPTKNFNIKFNAVFFSEKNKPVKDFLTQIEFYSVQNNQWVTLSEVKTNTLGALKSIFKIPSRIPKKDEITKAIKDTLSSGGIPAFRLISTNPSYQKNVLGNVIKIEVDKENLLVNINFGKNWFLPSTKILKSDKNVFYTTANHYEDDSEFQNCLTKVEVLNEKLKEETSDFKKLKNENRNLIKEKNKLAKSLEDCIKKNKETEEDIKKCDLSRKELESTYKKLQNDFNKVTNDLKKCEANDFDLISKDYKELEQQFKECGKITQEQIGIISANEITIKGLNNKISKFESDKNKALEDKFELENDLKKSDLALNNCQNNLQEILAKDYQKLEGKIQSLQENIIAINKEVEIYENENAQLIKDRDLLLTKLEDTKQYNESDNPNKVEAKTVYTGIVSELKEAQELMKDSNFKLGNIKLNLKAMINKSPTGINYELLDSFTAKDIPSESISTIEMEVFMNEPIEENNSEVLTPNLIGLTETAVRKKLSLIDCKLNPIYNSETGTNRILGQSFKQFPNEGLLISSNQLITVFFSKSKN